MEDEPLEGSSSLTYSEALDKLCAYYMAIGVSCDEFWHGDYTRLAMYREAHELKNEMINQQLWLQGAYVFDAVSIALSNALRTKRGKPTPYNSEPYNLKPEEKTPEKAEEEAEQARQKIVNDLSAWAESWEKTYGGEKR